MIVIGLQVVKPLIFMHKHFGKSIRSFFLPQNLIGFIVSNADEWAGDSLSLAVFKRLCNLSRRIYPLAT
jgi:hypothetical protein